jgi:hypothetical protein
LFPAYSRLSAINPADGNPRPRDLERTECAQASRNGRILHSVVHVQFAL